MKIGGKYASVRKWKKNIISKNHNKTLTKQAWTVRRSSFTKFLKLIGKNPDEIIDIVLSDNDQVKEWADEFYQECLKTTQKSSSISSAYGTIRGFFSNNDVITQNWSSPKIGVLQSHITDDYGFSYIA